MPNPLAATPPGIPTVYPSYKSGPAVSFRFIDHSPAGNFVTAEVFINKAGGQWDRLDFTQTSSQLQVMKATKGTHTSFFRAACSGQYDFEFQLNGARITAAKGDITNDGPPPIISFTLIVT